MQTNYIGAESFRTRNPYILDCYETDKYASIYPSIKAISNEFMSISPYAVDGKAKKLERVPIGLQALYNPNQLDSSISFREKLAVMNLTHRMTYVLVWRREGNKAVLGGQITANNIGGFTFLENPAITIRDKKTYYSVGAQEFSEDNVIAIPGGVDPSGLYRGYAPGIASARWATLDEYIADFQQGFFENGAIPAGQFVITSASIQDYNDTVAKLQEAHRGAGKNNNVTYTPRPVDPGTGKAAESKIEWIPFQVNNKDIDFKNLFDQANKRIESTFGVPASIRGVGESNNYATARVDQQNFIRFTIKPIALRIYTQITHELNRITGGLGYAITFELDYPAVADEEKVQEETKQIRDTRAQRWIELGYSISSVNNYLKSGNLEDLELEEVIEIEDGDADVDDGNEVLSSPNPDDVDGVTPVPRSEVAKGKNPKAEITDEDRIEAVAKTFMKSQIDRAISELNNDINALEEPTKDELDAFIVSMLAIVTTILIANGEEGYASGLALAGLTPEGLQGFMLTETAKDTYEMYLRRVGESYGKDTAESIRKVLLDANNNGLTRVETENALRNILDTDDWRVKRLGRTELNNAQNIGKLEGMKSLSAEVGGNWEKTIDHSKGNICPLCASQEGIWTALDQPLWGLGEAISTINDKNEQVIYINDWQENQANGYHPNCRGALIFRRVL